MYFLFVRLIPPVRALGGVEDYVIREQERNIEINLVIVGSASLKYFREVYLVGV